MRKLSEFNQNYIKENHTKKAPEVIAKERGLKVSTILEYIATLGEAPASPPEPVEQPPPQKLNRYFDMMICKNEASKKSNGAAVMTQPASEYFDEKRTQYRTRKYSEMIGKIRG